MIETHEHTIARIRETVQAAENSGRLDLMSPFMAEDIVIMAPGFGPVIGAAAAAEFMAGFFAQFDVDVAYTSAEVVVIGDWAFDRGSARQTLKPKDGGAPASESANYLWLYRRDPDGGWKHARVTWNSSGPAEASL